jgi:copper homeostasis protein
MLLEVIVQSAADAVEAERGGADRLEVVRDIGQGGLTPPLSRVREIAAATRLPLRVMVRARDGYVLDPADLRGLQQSARDLAALGVDGLVIGYATNGRPDLEAVGRVLDGAPAAVTFHRAFDALDDPAGALAPIASLPFVDRILTSGGEGSADARAARLAGYSARAGRLTIIAGGGVDREALAVFVRTGCVREAHVGRAARVGNEAAAPVSADLVRELRRIADGRPAPSA